MKRGACTWLEIAVFNDEEVACGVGGGNLEGQRTDAERARRAEAVLPGGDWMESGRGRRGLGEEIVEGGGRYGRRGGLEEASAGNRHDGNNIARKMGRDR